MFKNLNISQTVVVARRLHLGSRQVSEIAKTIEIFCLSQRVGTLLAFFSGKKKIYSSYANCSASWFFFDDLGCVKTLL